MSDLERLFRLLVRTLADVDPAWLHRPIPVGAMTREIIPYQDVRGTLNLVCSEDYESLLIRLCAGQEQLAELTDGDAQAQFAAAAANPHPDLDFLRHWAEATVTLRAPAVARALGGTPADDYAPAESTSAPPPEPEAARPVADLPRRQPDPQVIDFPGGLASEPPPSSVSSEEQCIYCGGALPTDRDAKFCPHCGQGQVMLRCPSCDAEVEIGWRHCIACGHSLPQL